MNRFVFYQPSPLTAIIDWCWTLVILLAGIIFWLEVTHFQWISLILIIVFFLVAVPEVVFRRLIFRGHQLIVRNMFNRDWRRFNLMSHANQVSVIHHQLLITNHGNRYQYFLMIPKRSINRLKVRLK